MRDRSFFTKIHNHTKNSNLSLMFPKRYEVNGAVEGGGEGGGGVLIIDNRAL